MTTQPATDHNPNAGKNLPLARLPLFTGFGTLAFALICTYIQFDYGGDKRLIYGAHVGVSAAIMCVQVTATALMTTVQAEKYLRWLAVDNHLKPMFKVFIRSMWWSCLWCVVSLIALVNTHFHPFTLVVPIVAAMSFSYTAQMLKMLATIGEIIFNRIQAEAWTSAEANRLEMDQKIGKSGSF